MKQSVICECIECGAIFESEFSLEDLSYYIVGPNGNVVVAGADDCRFCQRKAEAALVDRNPSESEQPWCDGCGALVVDGHCNCVDEGCGDEEDERPEFSRGEYPNGYELRHNMTEEIERDWPVADRYGDPDGRPMTPAEIKAIQLEQAILDGDVEPVVVLDRRYERDAQAQEDLERAEAERRS